MQKIRYGIVGCGFFGSVQAKELKKIKNAELVSVYSRSGDSAKKLSALVDCEYNLKLSDFADLSSDELTGAYDIVKGERVKIKGHLEDFALSKKEADELIMSAREIIFN